VKDQLNISLIQTDLYWEDRQKNIDRLTDIINTIQNGSDAQNDIIVLPESFTTGFSMNKQIAERGDETLEWMKKMAVATQSAIAGSYFVNEGGKCFNRLHFVEPEGKVTIYNKKHLFRLTNEQEVFSAGDKQVIVEYKGWKISLLVCYDLRFPVWMRRSDKNEYDMILLVANWPERRIYAWNQLLVARAIENQVYVAGVNRIGKDGLDVLYGGESAGIDPMGKIIARGASFAPEVVRFTVNYAWLQSVRKSLPFYEDRDSFQLS
jgi:omega-amidase